MFYLYMMMITALLFYVLFGLLFEEGELASQPIFEIFHYVFWPIGLPLLLYKVVAKLRASDGTGGAGR